MSQVSRVQIDGRPIGTGQPVYVIAEIGYNFRTDAELIDSIDAAIESGADAVKIQTFRADTVVSRKVDFPPEAGGGNQHEEFRAFEVSDGTHEVFFEHAAKRGVSAFSTPAYFDDVDLLERFGVPAHKVGSDDLTNLPFLAYVARTGKPLIFSTGMATMSEVAEAYEVILGTGNDQVCILHCLSNYPVGDSGNLNLRAIRTLASVFPVPVGFSDHTTSTWPPVAAVSLGAAIVERHFTISKTLDVPDAPFSADPSEFRAIVEAIRETEKALGDGIKRPSSTEKEMRSDTRKSLVAKRRIGKGQPIEVDNVIVKRPGHGVPPKHSEAVMGRRVARDIDEDEVISFDDLQ